MFTRLLKQVFFPEGKLPNSFPWTVQTAGKKYFVGLLHFTAGTLAVPLLFMALVGGLLVFPNLRDALANPQTHCYVLACAALVGAIASACINLWRLHGRDFAAVMKGLVNGAFVCVAIGAIFALALPAAVKLIDPVFPQLLSWVGALVADSKGSPNITFQMWLSLLSFVMGFGMQLRYIAKEMRKNGLSLTEAMALTLKPLKGSWWGATLFNLLAPVAIAYGFVQIVGESIVFLMGPAHQPTVELAQQATGGNFLLFAVMAVVGAPIFEELVFRGFLYQILRSSLARPLEAFTPRQLPACGICRLYGQLKNFVNGWTHCVAAFMHRIFGGKRAEISAIVLSSLAFSLLHMQFNPTTLVLLFMMGCVQAELYRRTGSLYCGMLLHAVNNGIDVLKLGLGG